MLNKNKIVGRTVAQIIPTIVSGLYNDKFDIAREYCQNGYDAILRKYGKAAGSKGSIDIHIKGRTLSFHDNGTGMIREVVFRLAEIGYSTKDSVDQVGYRGIGRLAGICGARKIIFITKAATENIEHSFAIDAGELIDSLDRQTKFNEDAGEILAKFSSHKEQCVNSNKSYTTVVMEDIFGEAGKLLRENDLRNYLEFNLPLPVNPGFPYANKINTLYDTYIHAFPNMKISLNGKQLYKPFHELDESLDFKVIEPLKNPRGKILAVGWHAWRPNVSKMIKNERLRGLRFRHRGFTIGEPADMRKILKTSPPQLPDWFVGEVVVIDRRLLVSSDRSRFEDSIARTELMQELLHCLGKDLTNIARDVSGKSSKKKAFAATQRINKELKDYASGKTHLSESQIRKKIEIVDKKKDTLFKAAFSAKSNKYYSEKAIRLIHEVNEAVTKAKAFGGEDNSIIKRCKLSPQAAEVYNIIKEAIDKHWDYVETVEELQTALENELLKKYGAR